MGRERFAATPIVDGDIIYHSGPGGNVKAYKLQKEGDKITHKELWSNPEVSLSFSTPVLKDGMLFGVTGTSQFFCIDAQSGKTAWIGPRDTGGGYGSVLAARPARKRTPSPAASTPTPAVITGIGSDVARTAQLIKPSVGIASLYSFCARGMRRAATFAMP